MKQKGFTLIELLVVISIISLLASVILVALTGARSKARDTKRRADLRQLATALELYYNDNRNYPCTGQAGAANCPVPLGSHTSNSWWGANCSSYNDGGTITTSGADGYIPNLAPTYVSALPIDPKWQNPGNCYIYESDGYNYKLMAFNTVESVVPNTDTMWDPRYGIGGISGSVPNTYSVYTPGAKAW